MGDPELGGGRPEPLKTWCDGKIYFDKDGCLYIADGSLADAIEKAIRNPKRKFCIAREDPNRPGHKQDVMCPC